MRVVLTREQGHNEDQRTWLPDDTLVTEVPLTTTHYFDVNHVRRELLNTNHVGAIKVLVVTSGRSARYVAAAKEALSEGALVLSVGTATTLALGDAVSTTDADDEGGALRLAAEIVEGPVLLIGATTMRSELPSALRARGIEVTKVACYETLPAVLSVEDERQLRGADVVFIGAPSAWQVAEGLIEARAWVVVPGATTGAEVRRSHERVIEGWGPGLKEHLRTL
ncbi:MAG TPA: uroporphyrinogen-III synthase [Acidimicrobiales bacterium]|nr:uroporphyrinogen-III synthase [Acidimicrobiales bacterium]